MHTDNTTSRPSVPTAKPTQPIEQHCTQCGEDIDPLRVLLLKKEERAILCLFCGEEAARSERASWCVLTPHKQGAMYFTKEFARQAAIGINNKGGIVHEGV